MPCGGGDIGMNVWVENGEVLIYVQRSGSFNEDNALLKSGRIRIRLSPNPFEGKVFKQELHLQDGFVSIDGKSAGVKATIKIWADVFSPVAHFEIASNKKIGVSAAYESWRYRDRVVLPRENFGNSWKWAAPKNNVYKQDSISFQGDEIEFYHHNNATTIFDVTVAQQGMNDVKDQLYNPLASLVSGGTFGGKNFLPDGITDGVYASTDNKAWWLKSKSASTHHALTLALNTKQTTDISAWKNDLLAMKRNALPPAKAWKKTRGWWNQFWQRSFIQVGQSDVDSNAWTVGRNFQLFRYMLACNSNGHFPTKFNGGLFTVDPIYTDTAYALTPDYRNWGGGLHTAQNQRLVYFPMIKNGDWDLLQPQFNFYLQLLRNAELRSKFYWNHGGACFTEQMENYGLPNYAEYGQKRPAGYDKGMEYNAWLEYEWDTVLEFCLMMLEENTYTGKDISDKIPFIESCLRFFDEHYQYLAKQRGSKALDGNGNLVLYPGSGAETFKMAYNATSTIAGLQVVSDRLLNLLSEKRVDHANTVDTSIVKKYRYILQFITRLPDFNYRVFDGKTTISPALNWERINNTESPQLYPVYPWGIFGLGKPGLDTAINTFLYDSSAVKFRGYLGWKQDNIWAARLGLTENAWDLTSKKLQNSGRRFPAFWGPGFDWVPDHNWGGSGMIGLQEMLLQTNGDSIMIFPSWPKTIDVHFKLHAPGNTTVEAEIKKGQLVLLKVIPEIRRKDVISFL